MKKLLFFGALILVLLFCAILYQKVHYGSESPESMLIKAFEDSGAKIVESEIYFWGRLEKNYRDINELKALTSSFAKELGLAGRSTYASRVVENDYCSKVESDGTDDKNRHIWINAQMEKRQGNTGDKIISVRINEDLSASGMIKARQDVMAVFRKHGVKPTVNSCITGSYSGKLGTDRLNAISGSMFRTAEAKRVEGIRNESLISVSAYSPYIDESIRVNGRKVNLNLAIRYNSFEDKTYIWLATPVITTEY